MKRLTRAIWPVPAYPILFVVAFLASELFGQWIPAAGLIRPFLALATGTIVILAAGARLGGRHRGALLAALTVVGAVQLQTAAYILVVATAPLAWGLLRQRRITALDWPRTTAILNALALVSVSVSGVNLAITVANTPRSGPFVPAGVSVAADRLPDIYLILLDMYPRADTLQAAVGFDNSPFLEELKSVGFAVSDEAHSNYNRTALTVPSVLNGAHIADLIAVPPPTITEQHRYIASLVNSGRAVGYARALGYKFWVIPSQVEFITPNSADRMFDGGQLSKFETLMTRNGYLGLLEGPATEWFRESHRDRVRSGFITLQAIPAIDAGAPKLVFAHLMVPHNPIVFRADGSISNVPECYWEECDLRPPLLDSVRTAFIDQVEYTNSAVLTTVRAILERSVEAPAIVLFSDHGFRHWLTDEPETFRSLLAAYTPGHEGVFPQDAAPVNIIPRLLNAYAGTRIALADEKVWFTIPDSERGDELGYFPLTRWDAEPGAHPTS